MKNEKIIKNMFLGDLESINIELVIKSFDYLKYKVKYILVCNKMTFLKIFISKNLI